MKTFDQFCKEITEGGNSLKSVKIVRINKANVLPTIDAVAAKLARFGLDRKHMDPIGSTGKKESSGDIDCACLYEPVFKKYHTTDKKIALNALAADMRRIFGEVYVYFGNQLTFPVAIVNKDGKQEGEYAQFDLMFTDDLEGSSFLYHSEEQVTSVYKSAHRNALLISIARFHKRKDLGDGVQERWWFSVQDGMLRGKEVTQGTKRKGVDKIAVSKDGDKVAKELLGPSFSKKDAVSFETLWAAIHSPKFVGKKNLKEIVAYFKADLPHMKLTAPKELG